MNLVIVESPAKAKTINISPLEMSVITNNKIKKSISF